MNGMMSPKEILGAADLAASEFREIHRLCDISGIDRHRYGEKLSAAQRVELLARKADPFQHRKPLW